jgi:FANCI solenoid 1/FANCI solenoid 2/FANCI helical domain 2/FANCI solenoid 4/FANCI helical domain 1
MEKNENGSDVSIDTLRLLYRNDHADFMKRICEFEANESKRAQQRNKQIVSSVVALLHKGDITDKQDLERVLEKCQQVSENVAGAYAPALVEQLLRPLTSGALLHPQTPVHGAETLSVKGFAKSLDLLPRLLSLSRAEQCVEEDLSGEADGLSGQQFHDHIISTMCSKKWPVGAGVALTATLKDLPLTDAQVKLAARSTLRHLRSLEDIEQLPALTFELLLLAGRPACREQIISGLMLTFDSLGEQADAADAQDQAGGFAIRHSAPPAAELRKIESKVLVQVSFAMRQDHELAAAVLRSFKKEVSPPSAAKVFTPFRAALLLTLARVQRFSAPALDACKELVLECAQFQHKRASSVWFNQAEGSSYAIVQKAARAAAAAAAEAAAGRSSSSGKRRRVKREEHADADDDAASSQPEVFPLAAVEQALLRTVQHCRAYDHLLPSLQDLGVRLMDQAKPAGKQGLGLYCHLKSSAPLAGAHAAAQLGCAVLQECFATHAVIRRTIVLEALSRLKGGLGGGSAAAGAAAGSGSSVAVYIQLLAVLAERSPILLLEHSQALRDTFGYLGTLPSHAAQQLLLAVSPLLRLRPQLQDAVVLPLRKALFSGVEEARLVAVEGLILLLRLPQTGRSSRSNSSSSSSSALAGFSFSQREEAALTQTQQGSSSSSSSGCAFTVPEGFSLLRRCLTQQLAVRSRLYAGLLAAFRDKGGAAALGSHTVSMLLGHFKRFVSLPAVAAAVADGERRGSTTVPLQLRRAIDDVQGVVEPLPQLIGVLFCLSCSGATGASAEQQADSNSSNSSAVEDPLTTAVADISTHLTALTTAMAAAEPEVFGLDCDCTFDAGTKSGRTQLAAASLVLGVYEALMAGAMLRYQAVAQELAADNEKGHARAAASAVRTVMALAERRLEVAELVRERVGGSSSSSSKAKTAAASKGGKAGAAKGKGKQKKGSKAAATAAADSDNDNDEGDAEGGAAPATGKVAAVATGPAPVGGAHISAVPSFVLTLEPGGLPCLGLPFVQSMLQLLTAGTGSSSCTQQQLQCDDAGSSSTSSSAAVKRAQNDPALHRLLLETARSTLKVMRTGLSPPGSLTAAVGGGPQLRPPADTPQSDSEAVASWTAAARLCTVLAPLLMSEARRQTDAGQNSSAVADALATAADDDTADCAAATKGSKGKKGKVKGKAGAPRKSAEESLTELALSCFEECVLIAAAGPPALCAKRVCKVLAAAHSSSSDSSSGSSSSSSSQQLFHDHAVWLLKQLQPMLRDGDVKEAEVVVRTLATVVPLLLRTAASGATTTEAALLGLDSFIDSLVQLCSSAKVTNPSLVRSLVALLLSARLENGSMRGDMLHIADVALQVRVAVGPISQDDDSEEAEQQQPKRASQAVDLSIIVPATAEAAAEAVIAALEACTEAAELALAQLVKETTTHTAQQAAAAGAAALCSSSSSGGSDSDDEAADSTAAALKCDSDVSDEDGDVEAKDPVDEREAFLSGRLRLLLSALDHLTQCALRGRAVDRVLSIISRCFRVLGRALKARISAKRYRVLRTTERLLEYKKGFTEHVTMFIGYVNSPDCCEAAAGSATRSARRAKLIPELVYQVCYCC